MVDLLRLRLIFELSVIFTYTTITNCSSRDDLKREGEIEPMNMSTDIVNKTLALFKTNTPFCLVAEFRLGSKRKEGSFEHAIINLEVEQWHRPLLRLEVSKLSQRKAKLVYDWIYLDSTSGRIYYWQLLTYPKLIRDSYNHVSICVKGSKHRRIKVLLNCRTEPSSKRLVSIKRSKLINTDSQHVLGSIGQSGDRIGDDQRGMKPSLSSLLVSSNIDQILNSCPYRLPTINVRSKSIKPVHEKEIDMKVNKEPDPVLEQINALKRLLEGQEMKIRMLTDHVGELTQKVLKMDKCQCLPKCLDGRSGQEYAIGASWTENASCSECKCTMHGSRCTTVTCPVLNCTDAFLQPPGPNECCPRCLAQCTFMGQLFDHGYEFEKDCVRCKCKDGTMHCHNVNQSQHCPTLSCPVDKRFLPPGKCCQKCKRIDICRLKSALCHPLAECHPTLRGFKCKCRQGYEGSGRRSPVPSDTALPGCRPKCQPKCLNGGHCSRPDVCDCPSGLGGDRCQFDLNECRLGLHNCAANARCVNLPGSFACVCHQQLLKEADRLDENNSHGDQHLLLADRRAFDDPRDELCKKPVKCLRIDSIDLTCPKDQLCTNTATGSVCRFEAFLPFFVAKNKLAALNESCLVETLGGFSVIRDKQLIRRPWSQRHGECNICQCQMGHLACPTWWQPRSLVDLTEIFPTLTSQPTSNMTKNRSELGHFCSDVCIESQFNTSSCCKRCMDMTRFKSSYQWMMIQTPDNATPNSRCSICPLDYVSNKTCYRLSCPSNIVPGMCQKQNPMCYPGSNEVPALNVNLTSPINNDSKTEACQKNDTLQYYSQSSISNCIQCICNNGTKICKWNNNSGTLSNQTTHFRQCDSMELLERALSDGLLIQTRS